MDVDLMFISCDTCEMQNSSHCRDCVVSALVAPSPKEGATVFDVDEERALRELAKVGLIPEIRMKRRNDRSA